MDQIIEFVNKNAGMVFIALGLFSVLMYKSLAAVSFVAKKVLGLFSYGISVDDTDRFMQYLYPWLSHQKYIRIKTFKVNIPWDGNINSISLDDIDMNPIDGTYYCKVKGRPLFSVNSRVEINGNALHKKADIRIFTLSRNSVRSFVNDVLDYAKTQDAGKVFKPVDRHYWESVCALDTEFFQRQFVSDCAQDILDDIGSFLQSKESYAQKNLKYRKGLLVHGLPGSGKSTLAGQIAAKHHMNVYIMSGADILNAGKLLSTVPHMSLVVFEDLDLSNLMKRDLGDSDKKSDTDSLGAMLAADSTGELLNALDGLVSMTGSIMFATTNKIEELDEALIRHGRFDKKIEMNELTREDQSRYVRRFYGDEDMIIPDTTRPTTIAELTSLCCDNIEYPEGLIEQLQQEPP